ncbi:hypothetical protein FOL46_005858 [Perkinsus olseni]|uniref:Ankyrin Repeat n=1 Tax=Perkinsus olseni TaxID=32597 RepID=A0A7J6LPB0_PEROL|nr:hypothetical protein FOL46_005858 [Perkinsus olseni]
MSSDTGNSASTTTATASPSPESKVAGEPLRLSQVANNDKVLETLCAFLPSVLIKLRRLSKIFHWRLDSERVGKILSKVAMELDVLSLDPFHIAACGEPDLLWLMIVTSDIDVRSCRDHDGGTLLQRAARSGSVSTVMVLLERGCNVNAKGSSGYTPLHEACYLVGKPAICDLLLTRGANVDAISRNGSTPLFVACREPGGAGVAATLLRYGAHPDDGGDKGWTPLFVASLTNQSDTVALLLSYSASINEVNPIDGRTPLHAAAEVAAIDVIEILLRHGADVYARDVHDRTPAETAGVGLGPEVLAQLREEGRLDDGEVLDDDEMMKLMVEHPRAKAVKEMLEAASAVVRPVDRLSAAAGGESIVDASPCPDILNKDLGLMPALQPAAPMVKRILQPEAGWDDQEVDKSDSNSNGNEAVLLSSYSATMSQRCGGGSVMTSLGGLDGIPEDSVAQASSSLISCIPAAVDFGASASSATGRFGLTSGDTDLLVVDDDTPSSLSGELQSLEVEPGVFVWVETDSPGVGLLTAALHAGEWVSESTPRQE